MVGGAYAPRHRWRRSIQVARLPSHSQGYCSTHERPGTWRSSPRFPYKVNTLNLVVEVLGGAGFFPDGFWGGLRVQGPLCRGRRRGGPAFFQGPPRASTGLQGPPPGPPGTGGGSSLQRLYSCGFLNGPPRIFKTFRASRSRGLQSMFRGLELRA